MKVIYYLSHKLFRLIGIIFSLPVLISAVCFHIAGQLQCKFKGKHEYNLFVPNIDEARCYVCLKKISKEEKNEVINAVLALQLRSSMPKNEGDVIGDVGEVD